MVDEEKSALEQAATEFGNAVHSVCKVLPKEFDDFYRGTMSLIYAAASDAIITTAESNADKLLAAENLLLEQLLKLGLENKDVFGVVWTASSANNSCNAVRAVYTSWVAQMRDCYVQIQAIMLAKKGEIQPGKMTFENVTTNLTMLLREVILYGVIGSALPVPMNDESLPAVRMFFKDVANYFNQPAPRDAPAPSAQAGDAAAGEDVPF